VAFVLYEKPTVHLARFGCHSVGVSQRQGPTVTFHMEPREASPVQMEAGRRLFKRLVDAARANNSECTSNTQGPCPKEKADGRPLAGPPATTHDTTTHDLPAR